jgi:hypothetical protein
VAITTIEGTGSFQPSAVCDDEWKVARARVHAPFLDHRRNCDQILVRESNCSGRNFH